MVTLFRTGGTRGIEFPLRLPNESHWEALRKIRHRQKPEIEYLFIPK